jgi:hypothetical protein
MTAPAAGRVRTETLLRHPRFLLFYCLCSVLLTGGRRCCLVAQRSVVVTALVRIVARAGRRLGYWG